MVVNQRSKTVVVVLHDGRPEGLVTIDISHQWGGRVFSIPTPRIPDIAEDEVLGSAGVYVLIGDNPDESPAHMVYVGQSGNVAQRLKQHLNNPPKVDDQPFEFTSAIAVTSRDRAVNVAHSMYLEHRLQEIVAHGRRARLISGQTPNKGSLAPHDIADMEYYIEQIRLALPLLGHYFLNPPVQDVRRDTVKAEGGVPESPVLEISQVEIRASGRFVGDRFVVFEGSTARASEAPTAQYKTLRKRLIDESILVPEPKVSPTHLRFTTNHEFSSLSAAAVVVVGATVSGPQTWKVHGTNMTYKEWLDSEGGRGATRTFTTPSNGNGAVQTI